MLSWAKRNIRIYSRYCVFASARQHGSFGARLCFDHEALRNTLTNPDLFGSLLTFILDLKIKIYHVNQNTPQQLGNLVLNRKLKCNKNIITISMGH